MTELLLFLLFRTRTQTDRQDRQTRQTDTLSISCFLLLSILSLSLSFFSPSPSLALSLSIRLSVLYTVATKKYWSNNQSLSRSYPKKSLDWDFWIDELPRCSSLRTVRCLATKKEWKGLIIISYHKRT